MIEDKNFVVYNHCFMKKGDPSSIDEFNTFKKLFKQSKALMGRYLINFDDITDCGYYYIIFDKYVPLTMMKKKQRYEIKKGLSNYQVVELSDCDCKEMYRVYLDASLRYHNFQCDEFEQYVKKLDFYNSKVYGAKNIHTNSIDGYIVIKNTDKITEISSLKLVPEALERNVSHALIYHIIEKHFKDIGEGGFIHNGAVALVHDTNMQEFLIHKFNFRKAYCRIKMIYRFPMGVLVKILYPFRKIIYKFKCLKLVSGVLLLEEFSKKSKKKREEYE